MKEIDLELTRRCNLRCGYCYLGEHPSDEELSDEVADAALQFIQRMGVPKVNFYGGEPLLAYDRLQWIVERAKALGLSLSYTAVTNGTIATAEMADYFRRNKVGVTRSIDGCPAALAINRPDILPAYMAATEIFNDRSKTRRATVSPAAAKYLLESVRFFQTGLGVAKGGTFIPDFYATWSEQEQSDFLDHLWLVSAEFVRDFKAGKPFYFYWFDREKRRFDLKDRSRCKFGCGAGRSMVAINCRGYVYPCHRFTTEAVDSDFCAGNVLEFASRPPTSDPRPPVFGPAWQTWQEHIASGRQARGCDACVASLTCSGNCAHVNYKATGEFSEPPPFYCRLKQEASRAVAWIDSQLRHINSRWYQQKNGKQQGGGKNQNGKRPVQVSPAAGTRQQAAAGRRPAPESVPALRADYHDGRPPANYSRCVQCGGHRPGAAQSACRGNCPPAENLPGVS